MATFAGIGYSQNLDHQLAALEAAEQAKSNLKQDQVDLAILFSTVHYPPDKIIPVISKILGRTHLIGSSTPAIIFSDRVATRGIGIMALASNNIRFETGCTEFLRLQNKTTAGQKMVKSTLTEFGLKERRLLLCFADGLMEGLSDLLNGVRHELNDNIPVILAGSSDDFRYQSTFQYYKDRACTESAVSLILGGRVQTGLSMQHGFKPIGKPRTVDKVDGHIILSINGQKASRIYEQYFGREADSIKNATAGPINFRYPLGIRVPGSPDFFLRNVIGLLDGGGIICQDKVPEGAEIHVMIGNPRSYLDAADTAAKDVRDQLALKKPGFVLVFESIARHRILGRNVAEELRLFRSALGQNVPLMGMYSFNEFLRFSQDHDDTPWLLQNGNVIVMGVA